VKFEALALVAMTNTALSPETSENTCQTTGITSMRTVFFKNLIAD
jgi:hypothetical protein